MGYKEGKKYIFEKIVNNIRSKYRGLQLNINNRKIKTKTIYLYVFCVLVPVLVTNIFIIGNALKASSDEEKNNINNVADAIARDISSSFESAVYVTIDLYASNSITNFLDAKYKNNVEFLKAYQEVFGNFIFYANSKRLVSDITLYSDNSTMTNGGRYYRTDAIQSEEWYQRFVQADVELLIYPYYDTKYVINKKRMISVIRKLNYIEMSNIEKIVKLDLNYNKIYETVKSSAYNTVVYVCHEDKILFSNEESSNAIKDDYSNVSRISMEDVQLHKTYTSYGLDFDIYVKGYKSNYVSMLKDNLWLIAILFLADALVPAIILSLFSNSITKRIYLLGKYMKKVKGEVFLLIPESVGKDEIGELLENYNLMVARMKNLIEYEYKSKMEQQELHLARQQAELLALYSQINPHFMFNVLESIRMRCVIKGEKETSQMVESLAKLMRKSAEWGADLISLEQEIGFMRDYLNLQKYRYGDGFNFKFRIDTDCCCYMIPSLVLVTFAENSCVHGLNRDGHSGTIFVSVNIENSFLHIEIEDTGIGMEQEQVQRMEKLLNEANIDDLQKSTSLGMLNACIRLKKYGGNQTRIIIESEKQNGTCVIIKIPIENLKRQVIS